MSVTATQLFAGYTPPADAVELCFYCCGRGKQEFKAARWAAFGQVVFGEQSRIANTTAIAFAGSKED